MDTQVAICAEAKTASTGFPFLLLPYELRLKIYHLSIPARTEVDLTERPTFRAESCHCNFISHFCRFRAIVPGDPRRQDAQFSEELYIPWDKSDDEREAKLMRTERMRVIRGLLLTSHQVREETLNVLYGDNLCCVMLLPRLAYYPEEYIEERVAPAKLDRIRHLMLVMHPEKMLMFNSHSTLWDRVLPNLASLRIVANQPYAKDEAPECAYVKRRDHWLATFALLLKCVDSKLPAAASLYIDIGGSKKEQALALVDTLSHPKQMIRTMMGDRLGRGDTDAARFRGYECSHCRP